MNSFSIRFLDAQINRRAFGEDTRLFGELTQCSLEWILAFREFTFGDRPGMLVRPSPIRSSGMDKKNLRAAPSSTV